MHSVATRAGLWRRSHGIARRCISSTSSLNESVSQAACKEPTKPGRDSSFEPPLDGAISNKFGADVIHKPPLQSLRKLPYQNYSFVTSIPTKTNMAILAGEITLPPSQKVRKNGKVVTTFNVATGGMWRLPVSSKVVASEDECTDPCLQYHKVAIHDDGLGKLAVRTLRRGMQVYVEGELETRVFNDSDTGIVKRDREIAVHATGQIMAWTEKGPVSIEHQ